MADPKKNPLIGAFRTPAPGSTPVTSTEGEPKTAPPVQDTPPKAAEPPKDAVPKVKADATAHTTPGDVKKSQEPSDPEKPSTGEVAKSIDEKKGAEASKTPAEEKEPSDQDGDKSKGKSIDIVSQVPVDEIIAKSLFKIDEKDPSFKELVEDIRKNGMKVPINVNRTADGKYEVIDGNRRLAAAKKLGMKTINATIMNLPDRLLRKGQFHSNLAPRLILEAPGEGGDKSPQLSDSAKPTKVKKPEELPKATDLKGKAEGAATAGPTEAKQSKEQPKATDPKGKAEGVAPAGPTEGKKPEEPPETTDSKGKSEKSIRTPTPKVEIVSGTTRKAAASQDEIPPDFSLTIVPNDKLGTVAMMPIDLIDDFEGHPFAVRDDADMEIMTVIFAICGGIVQSVMSGIGGMASASVTVPQEMVDTIEAVGFLQSIPLWLVTFIGSLFITILSFILIMTVYGRFFRLYFYTALAPLPLASFAGEGTSFAGKAFLKSYVGVCMEGVVIVLACMIFSAFASTSGPVLDTSLSAVTMSWQYVGETIFNMLVLVGLVKGAERIVREMFGL